MAACGAGGGDRFPAYDPLWERTNRHAGAMWAMVEIGLIPLRSQLAAVGLGVFASGYVRRAGVGHILKDGDFEGIQVVGDTVWIVKSNGDLYGAAMAGEKKRKAVHIKTKLSKDNDVEGLAFDRETNTLILACKGWPGKKKKEYQNLV